MKARARSASTSTCRIWRPTVPHQTVTVEAEVTKVEGRRVSFHVKARDEIDLIGEGEHERMIVPWDKFVSKVNEKAKKARVGTI